MRSILAWVVVLVAVPTSYAQLRLSVEGHTGSHAEAMGVYSLDGGLAFGIPRFIQSDTFGPPQPGWTPHYLYRAGDNGRWIIVKGEASMAEKQGVLISESSSSDTPAGLSWLSASAGDWVKEPSLRVSANVPDKPRDRAASDQAAPQLKRSSPQSVDSGAVLRSVHHEGAAGEGAEALTAANEMVAKLEAEISQLTKRALDAEAKLEGMEADLQSANFRQDELEQQLSAAQAAQLRSEADNAALEAQASAAAKHAAADLAVAQAAVAAAEATAADNAAAALLQQGTTGKDDGSGSSGSGSSNSEVRSLQAMLQLVEATAATRDAQLVALAPLLPVLDVAHAAAANTLGLGSRSAAAASLGALVCGFALAVALVVLSCCAPKKGHDASGASSSSGRHSTSSTSKSKSSTFRGSGSSQPVGAASQRRGGARSETINDEEGIEEAEERRRREDASSGEGSFGLPPARMRSSDAMSAPRPFQHCGTESVSVSDGRATKRPGRGQNQ